MALANSRNRRGEPLKTGLVLAGGGARGAYEMGIVLGIVEALGLKEEDPFPFPIMCGTSIGSINAGWIAGFADRGNLDAAELTRQWVELSLEHYLRLEPANLMISALARDEMGSRSLLNPEPFEQFAHAMPWENIQRNIRSGAVQALVFTALELDTGRTVWFAQMGEGREFPDWRDNRRTVKPTTLTPDHVLASSAIPIVLPARRIGDHFYSDGGTRFKTPIAAAIRAGAERLVVISLRNPDMSPAEMREKEKREGARGPLAPPPLMLMSQIMGALSFDSCRDDLERIRAINGLLDTLDDSLSEEQLATFHDAVTRERGAAWKKIPTLSFEPTLDLGDYALQKGREVMARHGWRQRWFLQLLEMKGHGDALSFLFFDRAFTEELVALGKEDALKRRDEIEAFFCEE